MKINDSGHSEHDGPPALGPFDLEQRYEEEIKPLVTELCSKAGDLGLPVFFIACYKADDAGVWLASTARGREGAVPQEFILIRAIIEGQFKAIKIPLGQ